MSADPFLSFAEITSAIRSKKLSAVELLQVHLQRIERWQPKLNAFVHIDDEAARASARKSSAAPTKTNSSSPSLKPSKTPVAPGKILQSEQF